MAREYSKYYSTEFVLSNPGVPVEYPLEYPFEPLMSPPARPRCRSSTTRVAFEYPLSHATENHASKIVSAYASAMGWASALAMGSATRSAMGSAMGSAWLRHTHKSIPPMYPVVLQRISRVPLDYPKSTLQCPSVPQTAPCNHLGLVSTPPPVLRRPPLLRTCGMLREYWKYRLIFKCPLEYP